MAYHFFVIFVLLSSAFGSLVHKNHERGKDFTFSSKKVVDFTIHISEAGEEYNEKIEVNPNKRTELFQVPAHPGVDRSDTLHDFKQNLSMLRFPHGKICFLFPLAKEQSAPEKLMRDLEKAKQMVITETRRVDTTWIVNGELTDRSALSDELSDFCAQYPIYHVKKAQESLEVIGIQTKERAHRTRRQASTGLNGTELCSGGMDLNTANQICPEPELKINKYSSCVKYIECDGRRIGRLADGGHEKSHDPGCRVVHGYGLISVCYEYICNIVSMDQHHYNYRNNHQQGSRSRGGSGEGSGQGSDEEESSEEGSGEEEGSGDVLE